MAESIENKLTQMLGEAKPTLVEFFNPTCPRCQAMAPVMDQLRERIGSKANILQIDESANPDLVPSTTCTVTLCTSCSSTARKPGAMAA